MKNLFLSFALTAVLGYFLPTVAWAQQTPGTLTFSVTTTEPSGNYNAVNVVAIWISDASNSFVTTKLRRAQAHVASLQQWISASSQNTTDAVTGATLSTHGTRTISWNATGVDGNVVNDGTYRVYVEMSDKNVGSYSTFVEFTKGPSAVTLSPANASYFTAMTLTWTPGSSAIAEDEAQLAFTCTPNPLSESSTISFSLAQPGDVSLVLRDLSGKSLAVIADANFPAGSYQVPLTSGILTDLPAGVYLLQLNLGYTSAVRKIVITW